MARVRKVDQVELNQKDVVDAFREAAATALVAAGVISIDEHDAIVRSEVPIGIRPKGDGTTIVLFDPAWEPEPVVEEEPAADA